MTPILDIKGLSVSFGDARVLRGIDLAIAPGESVGVIGESGCGKSVTWLAAMGLLPATAQVSGSVRLMGEELLHAPQQALERIRGRRIAMIFQDATSALNPVHRIGRQIAEALRLHRGMDGFAARAEARRLLDQVGIPEAARRLDAYPYELSGGQNQRVMIAMALAGQPDVLVADEPTTALDVTIQAQILQLLRDVQRDTGMALVMVSHDLGVIAELCQRAYVMYAGRIVEQASVGDLFSAPRHPYSSGLLAALPSLDGPRRRLVSIAGTVPAPEQDHRGCAFAPRCPRKIQACDHTDPRLAPIGSGRKQSAACLRLEAATAVIEHAA